MLIFAAAMGLLAPDDAWLVWPRAEGFVTGNQQSAANGSIEEQVPAGETVDDWSRMITDMRINGDQRAKQFTDTLKAGWKNACPGGRTVSDIFITPDFGGYVDARMDCPLNPQTGKPETMFMRVFNGEHGLYVLQVAFRHVPSAAETEWAQAQLNAAVLCTAKSPRPVCKR